MANKVSVGKPKVGGAVFVAPITGTTLPTDTTTSLHTNFKSLGYCSDDGLTNSIEKTSDDIKAWGGDVVLTTQTEFKDSFGFTLIESMDDNVLKTVFGSSNVSGAASTGYTVKVNATENEEMSWVVDMVLKGGSVKRIVIPSAKITELGEIAYKDDEAIGYEVTITASPDATGNTHYEYIK